MKFCLLFHIHLTSYHLNNFLQGKCIHNQQDTENLPKSSLNPEIWICVCAKSLQSCLTLCNPMDCSPSGSSVHGILQVRILEWIAVPFSKEYSRLRDRTHTSYVSWVSRQVLYHWHHLGSYGFLCYTKKQTYFSSADLC